MIQNVTEHFLNVLMNMRTKKMSQSVNQKARECLLDYLGVTIGGKRCLQDRHSDLLESLSDKSVVDFAILFGFCAHELELDDGHRLGMIHLEASIITAVLVAAKEEKLSADNVLCGIVMGYEAAVRCARAIQPGHKIRGYHVSGTCGTIGSAMGVAFACGYSKEQLKSTLACAASSAAGLLAVGR